MTKRTKTTPLHIDDEQPKKKRKTDTSENREKNLREKTGRIISSGWELVEKQEIKLHTHHSVPPSVSIMISRRKYNSPLHIFQLFLCDRVLEAMVLFLNRNRISFLSGENNGVSKSTEKYYKKEITKRDFLIFYGVIMHLENNKGRAKENRIQTKMLKNLNISSKMGTKRFKVIKRCLRPNNKEFESIFSIISRNCRKHWVGSSYAAIDETVYAYFPCDNTKKEAEEEGDRIPLTFVPRKPHLNGLLNYKMCQKSAKTKQPYMIDFYPRYDVTKKLSPRIVFERLAERNENNNHYIVDSAFGSFDLLKEALENNTLVTSSMSTVHDSFLWPVLELGLSKGEWRAVRKDNIIVSVKHSEKYDSAFHHLASDAVFDTNPSQSDHKATSDLTKEIEEFKEKISKKKRADIVKLLREKGLKTSGLKGQLVDRMVEYHRKTVGLDDPEGAVLEDFRKKKFKANDDILHKIYHDNFNATDRHNELWYRFNFCFQINNWRSKLILSILTDVVTNAYVLTREERNLSLEQFRKDISASLLDQ